jgi:colanic acid biosynthesis protein WcaH
MEEQTFIELNKKNYIEDNLYKEIIRSIPFITVDILLFNYNLTETLVFKRENAPLKGQFFSIGGRVFKNEPFIQTAIRKMKEEIGISVDIQEIIFGGVQDEIFGDSIFEGVGMHNVNIFYGYILKENDTIKLDSQHVEFKWLNVDNTQIHSLLQKKIDLVISRIKDEQSK